MKSSNIKFHGNPSSRSRDSTWRRTGGEVKGKLPNAVGSQYPSHYLGTWCIQHYYRWCAHIGCQQSTELTPPSADLNGLARCAARPNLVSARVPSRFKRALTIYVPRRSEIHSYSAPEAQSPHKLLRLPLFPSPWHFLQPIIPCIVRSKVRCSWQTRHGRQIQSVTTRLYPTAESETICLSVGTVARLCKAENERRVVMKL